MSPRHLVLIGAARSGTKVLRDALAQAALVGAVPYDVGYVWRYGNDDCPDDTLAGRAPSERARTFIRHFVDRYAGGAPSTVIEKTVGNTMRVPFVADVLPDAQFVHIVRDGVDVIESTMRQWRAPTELRYALKKARHFPLRLVPSYGRRYAVASWRRRRNARQANATWGVRYPGIDADVQQCDLLTVCTRQWVQSLRRADADLHIVGRPVVEVRYEDLVADPDKQLSRVLEAFGVASRDQDVRRAAAQIRGATVGSGRRALSPEQLLVVEREAGDLLARLGYAPAAP
jgi:hypothetical protein